MGCEEFPAGSPAATTPTAAATGPEQPVTVQPEVPARRDWALLLHGGFVDLTEDDLRRARIEQAADAAAARLAQGQAALQVVSELIAELEEDPLFNAGRGSTFTRRGVHEMSAGLMDGRTRAFGMVGGLRNIRSPIAAARGALEHHQGGLLMGDAADALGRSLSLPRATQDSFTTRERFGSWRRFRQEAQRLEREGRRLPLPLDPIGAIALDSFGNLAAAASFGGFPDAEPEQAIALTSVGPGLYADNRGAAVLAVGAEDRLVSCQFPATVATRSAQPEPSLHEILAAAAADCGGPAPLGLLAIDPAGHTAILSPNEGARLLFAVREAALPTVSPPSSATGREPDRTLPE